MTDGPDPLEQRLIGTLPRLRSHLARSRVAGGDVDDVVQEVMARALRYRTSFDSGRALWPWLRRMAEHVLLDHERARARRPAPSRDLDPAAPERRAGLDAREEVQRLLAQLPERQRDVLLRFHRLGQSVRDIARALDLPEGTVKSDLSRARRKLATGGTA